jgi:hypothetical protein
MQQRDVDVERDFLGGADLDVRQQDPAGAELRQQTGRQGGCGGPFGR